MIKLKIEEFKKLQKLVKGMKIDETKPQLMYCKLDKNGIGTICDGFRMHHVKLTDEEIPKDTLLDFETIKEFKAKTIIFLNYEGDDVSLTDGRISIKFSDADHNFPDVDAIERFEYKYDPEKTIESMFTVNLDLLKQFANQNSTIQMHIKNSLAPISIRNTEGEHLGIIMPIRTAQ